MASNQTDVLIVGGGPAGLNAALILGRACKSVTIIDAGTPRNRQVERAFGFLTRDATAPREILAIGRQQLEKYDVHFMTAKVETAEAVDEGFRLGLSDGETLTGKKLILSTGVIDEPPAIEGMAELWGRSVFSCPYCDGWETRESRIAILGNGKAGYEFSLLLDNWCRDVTLCLDGGPAPEDWQLAYLEKLGIKVMPEKIARLEGKGGQLEQVVFSGGATMPCDAVFFHSEPKLPDPLALQLGCKVEKNGCAILTDAKGRTSIKGVYAAGDRMTPQNLLITAAASGAVAGFTVNEDLCEERHAEGFGSKDAAAPPTCPA